MAEARERVGGRVGIVSGKNPYCGNTTYKRKFGGEAEMSYQHALEAATVASMKITSEYSEDQCATYLQVFEGLSLADPKALNALFVDPHFANERRLIPACRS